MKTAIPTRYSRAVSIHALDKFCHAGVSSTHAGRWPDFGTESNATTRPNS